MANFLVTGGAGFIGSNLTDKLLSEGHFVRVLDNFSSGKEENLELAKSYGDDQFELVRGDFQNRQIADHACKGIDFINHQAALRSVPKSMDDPHSYNEVNIDGMLTLLESARDADVKRFVFASSSSVYGNVDCYPQVETFYPKLISPYALSKLAGEYYCRIFSKHYGVETVCLRYFNVFGPRQALDDEYAVVVPKFIHSILNDTPPPIFGDGGQSRDFTYIDNVVSANILAATVPGVKHEIFNVASGYDQTVLKIVEVVNRILGRSVQPEHLPVRAGDVYKTHADIAKIKEKLGFEVLVDFEEGLRKTTEYFKNKFL